MLKADFAIFPRAWDVNINWVRTEGRSRALVTVPFSFPQLYPSLYVTYSWLISLSSLCSLTSTMGVSAKRVGRIKHLVQLSV